MKKEMKDNVYPFEWLDNLVMVKLNSERSKLEWLTDEELISCENQISFEIWGLLNHVKVKTFGKSEKKISAFINHYLVTLDSILDQCKKNISDCDSSAAVKLNKVISNSIKELKLEVTDRYKRYIHPQRHASLVKKAANFKVLCRLSVDQIGILIKAADDVKLILSRSMSLIFRSLVPFLSTEKIKNISWMSMRKSTYQFERADLDKVVEVLEGLLKRVKGYY
jgi:hypothetical protein